MSFSIIERWEAGEVKTESTYRKDGQKRSETVKDRKESIRVRMLEKRAGLPEDYCRMADREILRRILAMEAYKNAEVLFTYVSTASEADTAALIVQALEDKKNVAVPRCAAKGVMEAYFIGGIGDLEKGAYGILEPVKGCKKADKRDMDLAVIPCVCCSLQGVRMGYGGGYYDRYLPGCSAVRAVLCREMMMVSSLPAESHDCAADFVITEAQVLKF